MRTTVRKCKLQGVVRNGEKKKIFLERIELIVNQISKIAILAALHVHYRLNKIVINANRTELTQEFSKPANDRLFEDDFFCFRVGARGNNFLILI